MISDKALDLTKLIGSKELSFGALVHTNGDDFSDIMTYVGDWHYIDPLGRLLYTSENEMSDGYTEGRWFTVIGHPCQLHDLFRWAKEEELDIVIESVYNFHNAIIIGTLRIEGFNPTLPLYSQSDETLQSIINLIEEKQKIKDSWKVVKISYITK